MKTKEQLKQEFESKFHHLDSEPKKVYSMYSIADIWEWIETEAIQVQARVKPDACGEWQKEKPSKPCYFIHRYNRKDNKPSLFEAVIDGGVLVVANIQDDEFVETMEDFADGDFFIIEKY